jgi:hypothetical protein
MVACCMSVFHMYGGKPRETVGLVGCRIETLDQAKVIQSRYLQSRATSRSQPASIIDHISSTLLSDLPSFDLADLCGDFLSIMCASTKLALDFLYWDLLDSRLFEVTFSTTVRSLLLPNSVLI